MGEMIRKIGAITIANQCFDVELNKSSVGSIEHEIHIQNKKYRLALSERQFCKMTTCILLARKQLHQIKGTGKK